jgi:hypothetical protein
MSRPVAVSRAGPGSPGAVRAVPVASADAVQIRPGHPYGTHDPAAALRLPQLIPGDDDGSI